MIKKLQTDRALVYPNLKRKMGYSFVEVIVGTFILTVFASLVVRFVAYQYSSRTAGIVNAHFVNVSDMIGNYLAVTDETNPGFSIFSTGKLPFVDASSPNLEIEVVEVNDNGWVNPPIVITGGPGAYSIASPSVVNYGGETMEGAMSYAMITWFDGNNTEQVFTIGGAGSAVVLPDGTPIIAGINYRIRVFREKNTSVTPAVVNYRIIIRPSDANMFGNLGARAWRRVGTEITYTKSN